MNNELKQKKIIQIGLVAGISLLLGVIWLLTLKYNLQGGFGKKMQTASPAAASGSLSEIDAKIKTLKENFKTSQEQINKLIEQQK